jgi:hypothetical protein
MIEKFLNSSEDYIKYAVFLLRSYFSMNEFEGNELKLKQFWPLINNGIFKTLCNLLKTTQDDSIIVFII